MTLEIGIVLGLVLVAVALFVSERLPVGLIALGVMAALMVTGILDPAAGLSGFSNRATVTIAAMFVLSDGVRRTGILERAAGLIADTGRDSPLRALLTIMALVGVISAFINNTAAVAIFIPVILAVAGRLEISPSRLLMPASFAAMFGGACTLIGTSTNILVSGIAADQGLAPLGMFELAPMGLVFAAIGLVYLATIGWKLVPARRDSDHMRGGYDLSRYITDVDVGEDSPLAGGQAGEMVADEVEIVDVLRDGQEVRGRIGAIILEPGDVLRVHGPAARISELVADGGVRLRGVDTWRERDLAEGDHLLVEAVVAHDSFLTRRRIRDARFGERFGAVPLAIQHQGSLRRGSLGDVRLRAGDCLLLAVDAERRDELEQDGSLVLVSRVAAPRPRRDKTIPAVAIVAAVVTATALGLAPIVVSALVGIVAMVLTGCLDLDECVAAINWEVILLLAGMIPLGVALDRTGAASLLAGSVVDRLGAGGPQVVLGGLLLLTILLTSVLNNQAAAVLLSPMVIELARGLGADPRPFLIAVTFGASLSFITPVGYQTNTMVYGPGQYRFGDFFRVGAGLNLLLWVAGWLLIPVFWPLGG